MKTLHLLTLRTATAVGRLAELQRRAQSAERPCAIARSALAELSTALEELQVATEALQTQVDEMTAVREGAEKGLRVADELAEAIPTAALWTDGTGIIQQGNEAASQLLNIGRQHLPGKAMMLFTTDRDVLSAALTYLSERGGAVAIDVEIAVRPRERRSRKMKLAGRRLRHDSRLVWFLDDIRGDDRIQQPVEKREGTAETSG